MNEHTIAPAQPAEPTPETPAHPAEASLGKDPQEMSVESYFGLHNLDSNEIATVKELVRVIGAEHQADMLYTLQQLDARAGNPPLGMSRLQHLYNFAKLESQWRQMGQQLQQYGS